MSYLPPFIDEFTGETGRVVDCVPASGLMGANKQKLGKYPATAAEREALQNAMGTQDLGANADQLAAGILKRYGFSVAHGSGWAPIDAALRDPKKGVALFGSYPKLPYALRAHGRQPGFTGLHCMYGQSNNPPLGTTTIGDPLATSYYTGITISQLQAYCAGLGYMYVIFEEEDIEVIITENPIPSTFWQAKGGALTGYKPGAAPLTRTFNVGSQASASAIAVKVVGGIGWPAPPLLYVSTGGLAGYYIPQSAVTFTAPDPCSPIKNELAIANTKLANALTRINTIKSKVASGAADVAND